jgi:SPP1 family predicted phage head-tail adaptor
LKAGALNYRVTFWHNTQLADGAGGSKPTRVDIRTTNAHVRPLRQDRTLQANQGDLIGGYEIYIRYRVDFTPLKTMFIDYRGITLSINSVQQWDEDREVWFIVGMVKK